MRILVADDHPQTRQFPRISENRREQIFLRFVRGQHSRPGFGLGLAFARAVARAHGGDLTLADYDPEGTTALMRLPLVSRSVPLLQADRRVDPSEQLVCFKRFR